MAGGYRIVDEPAPSAFGRFAVNPFWIVLAGMFGPAFLAGIVPHPNLLVLMWFGVNSFAVSSPTRRAELAWIAAGAAVIVGFPYLPYLAMAAAVAPAAFHAAIPYLWILRSAIDLTVLYRLFLYQAGPYQLYRYLNPDRA